MNSTLKTHLLALWTMVKCFAAIAAAASLVYAMEKFPREVGMASAIIFIGAFVCIAYYLALDAAKDRLKGDGK